MIVYNTTYVVTTAIEAQWVEWVKTVLIPACTEGGLLSEPRLYKVLSHVEDGASYSLQFTAQSPAEMKRWQEQRQQAITDMTSRKFGNSVLPFSTFLRRII